MKKTLSCVACIALCTFASANDIQLNTITVEDSDTSTFQQKGALKDLVEKTEVINQKEINQTQSATLAEAISKQAGISVSTGDSLCGFKRVQINGLQGEHTTVLVDGIPFNSTVSSFYGMDAISTADIESIEIARGAGASLTAPEAIGGTINIIPRKPHGNGVEIDTSMGTLGTKNYSLLGEMMTSDKKTGILISTAYHAQGQVDNDHNGISESPSMENQSLSLMLTHEFSLYDSMELKASHFTSNVFGGPMVSESSAVARYNGTQTNPVFIGDNVKNTFIGNPMSVLERVNTTRNELYFKEHHILNNSMNLQTTLAYSEQKQDSLYEGADYANVDKTYFTDIKIDHALNNNHFVTYGTDAKIEKARSESKFYYVDQGKAKDDFDYSALGIYAQDAWLIDSANELTLALRGTKITTNWLAQTAKENEIDQTLLVPRFHFRHNHTNDLTSRLSAGLGYRSPLTFFESEHGLLDSGFAMGITELEKSKGANYSLAYNANGLTITLSTAYTKVKNLAYVDTTGIPTLKNYEGEVTVKNGDIVIGYALNEALTLSGAYETYHYDDAYKAHLALAAIEQRTRFSVNYDLYGWNVYTEAIWVGARDLAPFGYANRYNDLALTSPKNTTAPAYTTVDLKLSKTVSKNFTLYAGAKNLFNYVQTNTESPLFYTSDGSFNASYVWGPLRGRTVYAGLKMIF
ncbi:TonB-dependent receptor plug domain-containing protein [Sulfuricurvum sp.]|uniref:TonB-dependent receptor plug domain-containing protein n=1 Tax=Sulfuricurvum sp. TaxID=2025608 RepID=UPI003566CCC5